MNVGNAACLGVFVVFVVLLFSMPPAYASLCQTINVYTAYPHQVPSNQDVAVTTTVAGSCTSDGEDYFAVRVDLVDNASEMVLTSNSTPIGYNANNFSVSIENRAVSPASNQKWSIEANTYLIQAGAASGKYLLNATTLTINVGEYPIPEFHNDSSATLLGGLSLVSILMVVLRRRGGSHLKREGESL